LDCRRFCSGRSTEAQQRSTSNKAAAAKPSTPIACGLQNPIDFNMLWNLVRDQGVGGSNPLSPTNPFKYLHPETKLKDRVPGFCLGLDFGEPLNTKLFWAARVRRHPQHRLQPFTPAKPTPKNSQQFIQKKRKRVRVVSSDRDFHRYAYRTVQSLPEASVSEMLSQSHFSQFDL